MMTSVAPNDSEMNALKKEKLKAYEASLGAFELKAFEALEREFQEVLQELQADKSLDRFRLEYEKLHRALKKSHESEKRLIKKCRELNTEILANATKVQNALKLNEEDQSTISALKKEIDRAWKMVDSSREKETKAKDNIQQLKVEIANLSQIIEQGTGLSTGHEKELNALIKQKEELCKERDAQLTYIVQLRKEVGNSNEKVRLLEDQKFTLEHEVGSLKDQIEAKKAEENSQKQVELKIKDDEIQAVKDEVVRVNKVREATLSKLKAAEKLKEEAEAQRNQLQNEIQVLEREVESQKKHAEQERKKQEELLRERDVLNKMKTQAENSIGKQADMVRINEVAIRNLEAEIKNYRDAAEKQDKIIQQMERERQKYAVEASQAGLKYMQALDEVKAKEISIIDLQKKILDGENRLKQQQNLYESVRSERNMYSKNLVDSEDEIEELKRRMKIMNNQIEQLKEEINTKELALIKEHFDYTKVEKEREQLKQDLSRAQQQIKEAEAVISSHVSNVENLNHIISEADDERFSQKKELDIVKSEREILAKQLMRRNEELALLYEKIKIQQSTLNKGMVQYRARLNEIRILKIKLTDLKREHSILKGSVKNISVLKCEVHNLGRELLQERTKVKALSEELENPLNVHRWRQLEGTDPTAYEMILKIQTLQKRLILKTEQVVEKDLLIQEKEKLYVELRSILARQPGPEVAEQLSMYAKKFKEKTRQMKAMQSELQMYQDQAKELKSEVDKLNTELDSVKCAFYERKRKEQDENRKQKESNLTLPDETRSSHPKVLGGGFSMLSGVGLATWKREKQTVV